jgi:ABC-2 type transport system permease protein
VLLLEIFGLQLVLAFSITAFGVMAPRAIKQMQSFMAVTQMIMMPMFFVSGAMFPVSGLPTWLAILNRIDPLTYAVDPMRRLVFATCTSATLARRHCLIPASPGGAGTCRACSRPAWSRLGLGMLAIAIWQFARVE